MRALDVASRWLRCRDRTVALADDAKALLRRAGPKERTWRDRLNERSSSCPVEAGLRWQALSSSSSPLAPLVRRKQQEGGGYDDEQ